MSPVQSLKKLLAHIVLNKPLIITGLLSVMLVTATRLLIPSLIGDLLSIMYDQPAVSQINQLGIMLGLAFIGQAFFSFIRRRIFSKIAADTLAVLRIKAFHHILHLPMSFFSNRSASELSSRISSDIQVLERFFKNIIPVSIRLSATCVGGIVMLFVTSWELSIIFVLAFVLIILVFKVYGRKIRLVSTLLQKYIARSNTIVQESLVNIYSVKSFQNESQQGNKYNKSIGEVNILGIKLGNTEALFSLLSDLTTGLLLISIVWLGSYWITIGALDIGDMLSFAAYLIMVVMAFSDITNIFSDIQRGLGSVRAVQELIEEPKEPLGELNKTALSGAFSFEGVKFSYPSSPSITVLKDISFKVPKGKRWALVGTSGSGKSTLAALLLHLYQPDEGVIRFDGIRQEELSVNDIRNHIAVIPQSSSLFTGTIRENILFGKPDATEEEFIEVATETSIDEFVKDFPDGYETPVGEHGMRLSGGQKQRILLARAMLKKPKILVLDEATSALDNETEMLIQVAIHLITKKCTSLIIAHRLSTIKNADKILVMMHGEIVEQGTYEELMAKPNSHFRFLNLTNFKG